MLKEDEVVVAVMAREVLHLIFFVFYANATIQYETVRITLL